MILKVVPGDFGTTLKPLSKFRIELSYNVTHVGKLFCYQIRRMEWYELEFYPRSSGLLWDVWAFDSGSLFQKLS